MRDTGGEGGGAGAEQISRSEKDQVGRRSVDPPCSFRGDPVVVRWSSVGREEKGERRYRVEVVTTEAAVLSHGDGRRMKWSRSNWEFTFCG